MFPTRFADVAVARLVVVAVAVMMVLGIVIGRSGAAFTALTTNPDNRIVAAGIALTDNDAGAQMFNVTGMTPSDTETRCIEVTYTGTIDPGEVRLYPTLDVGNSTGLQTYLNIQVEEGTWSGAPPVFPGCTNFSAGSTLFSTGDLTTFFSTYTDYASGLVGWDPAGTGESRVYRVTITMDDDDNAQSLAAEFDITWETQG